MKTENNFWKTFAIILIVVLVVGAVIVFWRNPELSPSGGVVKVQQSKYGPEVYTKAEVDAKLKGINSGVLRMLGDSEVVNTIEISKDCDEICKNAFNNTKKCILGFLDVIYLDHPKIGTSAFTYPVPCDRSPIDFASQTQEGYSQLNTACICV